MPVHSSPGLREQRLPGHSFEHKKEGQSQEPVDIRPAGDGEKKRQEPKGKKEINRRRAKSSEEQRYRDIFCVDSFVYERRVNSLVLVCSLS